MNLRPDPTFHATPKLAMEAPAETLAFTLMLSPDGSQPDGLAVVDVDCPSSEFFGLPGPFSNGGSGSVSVQV